MRRAFCVVALLALACLLPRVARVGLAGDYVDPIGRIIAQDEALYAHSAIRMALHGDWLTPRFMGRLALYKPPMLIWNAALSAKVFGIDRFTLRLPGTILAAVAVALIFLWGAESAGIYAGACAALFLLGNHLFHTLSVLCMTDGLLVAFTAIAVYCLYADPWLESRAALWGFSAASAAAILTKGIGGVFPLAILFVFRAVVRRAERPAGLRVMAAAGLAIALAAPWFVYQWVVHPRWFWREHILVEILGYGVGAPPQTSAESPALFYLVRLAATDPLLLSAFAIAVPAFFTALRRRTAGPALLACWLGLALAAILGWHYRNASYLLALIPPLALVAAGYGPFSTRRSSPWLLAILCAGILVKLTSPEATWGLNYSTVTVQPVAAALSQYCSEARSTNLIVVGVADDLYASVLPLYRVRYALVGDLPAGGDYGMPFEELGIVVTVAQFNYLARLEGTFLDHLQEWGVRTPAPIATLIHVRSDAELAELVRAHPEIDFLAANRYLRKVADSTHDYAAAGPGYFFLRSRVPGPKRALSWTCGM